MKQGKIKAARKAQCLAQVASEIAKTDQIIAGFAHIFQNSDKRKQSKKMLAPQNTLNTTANFGMHALYDKQHVI